QHIAEVQRYVQQLAVTAERQTCRQVLGAERVQLVAAERADVFIRRVLAQGNGVAGFELIAFDGKSGDHSMLRRFAGAGNGRYIQFPSVGGKQNAQVTGAADLGGVDNFLLGHVNQQHLATVGNGQQSSVRAKRQVSRPTREQQLLADGGQYLVRRHDR